MKRELLILISLLVLLHFPLSTFAGLPADVENSCMFTDSCRKPLLLYFRFDSSLVDYDYMDNPHTLNKFASLFADSLLISYIDSISITSYASPDGNARYNLALVNRRADAVKGYLVWKYPGLDQHRIQILPGGENWAGLRQLVEIDDAVPNREEVIEILDKVPDTERCKVLLRRLDKGIAYRYINKHLLPRLRNAAICMVRLKEPTHDSILENVKSDKITSVAHAEVSDCIAYTPAIFPVFDSNKYPVGSSHCSPLLALKTNLLSWVGFTSNGDIASFRPNLSAEIFFARRWSVIGSAEYSNWRGGKSNKFWGVSGYSIESRVWLLDTDSYRWLYLGVYGKFGDFDYRPEPDCALVCDGSSVTGTYWDSGLSLGVYLPLTSHWGLEAGLRGGYRKTVGKAYDYEPPHAYYHHDAPSTHWGITGFIFSLTYRWLTK